jgi:hypothetical protein
MLLKTYIVRNETKKEYFLCAYTPETLKDFLQKAEHTQQKHFKNNKFKVELITDNIKEPETIIFDKVKEIKNFAIKLMREMILKCIS